ncbi:hypothetical protein [Enterobacter cloacae complex sp. 357B1]|uniref:hypothetical protein n=1 Tax=Enterobacter cloacae complex sp. 357B1 TaxID=3395827 RepID=UPI003CF3453C
MGLWLMSYAMCCKCIEWSITNYNHKMVLMKPNKLDINDIPGKFINASIFPNSNAPEYFKCQDNEIAYVDEENKTV